MICKSGCSTRKGWTGRDRRLSLHRAMKRSEAEPLALEQIQPAGELDRRLAEAHAARQKALDRLAHLDVQRTLRRPDPPRFRGPPTRWPELRGPERGMSLEL